MIANNIYDNLQHFSNDTNVQVDNGNTKTKQIQHTPNIHKSQNIQTKSEKIPSPWKLFHDTPFDYLPRTCASRRFYNNFISKSKSHLNYTVTLPFYVLFLGLFFRNVLLSPMLDHGFSGENTPFLKISFIYIDTSHKIFTTQRKYFMN